MSLCDIVLIFKQFKDHLLCFKFMLFIFLAAEIDYMYM